MAKYFKYSPESTEKYPAYPIGERFVVLLLANRFVDRPHLALINKDGSLTLKPGLLVVPENWGAVEISDRSNSTGGCLVDG